MTVRIKTKERESVTSSERGRSAIRLLLNKQKSDKKTKNRARN